MKVFGVCDEYAHELRIMMICYFYSIAHNFVKSEKTKYILLLSLKTHSGRMLSLFLTYLVQKATRFYVNETLQKFYLS